MACYVDAVQFHGGSASFKWPRSCHLYADTLEELHAMAQAIGMRREWFQNHPEHPHYDLVPTRRLRAVELGAIEHDRHQAAEFWRRKRGAALTPSLFGGE